MKRKFARVGDVISYSARHEIRRGTVTKRSSDYLTVTLEKPRALEDWETKLRHDPNPYEDYVYLRSEYTIEEASNG